MNVNLGIWDKLSKLVLFLLFVAGVLCVFVWYLPLIQKNQRYRKEIISIDTKIAEQEKQGRQMRSAIDSLQNDPRAVERMAREKLGWARTNEMVVRFEQPAGADRRR
jgi:cell division protein FtsL